MLLIPARLFAQENPPTVPIMGEVFVNSELERYLRVLQTAGVTKPYPWSIRGFSMEEVERLAPTDSMHPWAERYEFRTEDTHGFQWRLLRPESRVIYNSGFPFGENDGAIWAGKGATVALQGGVVARAGAFSMVLAPQVFWSQNATFDIMPNGRTGRLAYADARRPNLIDLPQRFGEAAYARVDPGQSTLRLDAGGVALGVSAANQHWGPAVEQPLLLGSNAGGYPHLFVGTSAPVNLWVGRGHARVVWGVLDQSEFFFTEGTASRRFTSGAVAVFTPRGLPNLEVGAARFFHTPWREGGPILRDYLKPFEGVLKYRLPRTGVGNDSLSDADNQLASLFARATFPSSGLEVYGEYGRDDHNWDFRDFLLEPDHTAAYVLGFQKSWQPADSALLAVRGEMMNSQISHLANVRGQNAFYVHTGAVQGHTQRGQLLGAAAGYGGAAVRLTADYYYPRGRWTVKWGRTLRQDLSRHEGDPMIPVGASAPDVIHFVGADLLTFRGRYDVEAGLTGVYNTDRNFNGDVFDASLSLTVRTALPSRR